MKTKVMLAKQRFEEGLIYEGRWGFMRTYGSESPKHEFIKLMYGLALKDTNYLYNISTRYKHYEFDVLWITNDGKIIVREIETNQSPNNLENKKKHLNNCCKKGIIDDFKIINPANFPNDFFEVLEIIKKNEGF